MEKILKTICFLGLLEISYAILQLFGLVPDNYRPAYFSGSLNNPAIFGMFLSFCIPITAYFSIKKKRKTLWGVMFLGFATFIVLSNSRTAFISSLCGVAMVYAMEWEPLFYRLKSKRVWTSGVACLVLVFVLLYFYKRDSADGRILIWTVCLDMIKEKPLFGWGFDGYTAQYMNFQADYLASHPHSPYALLAGETQTPFNEFMHVAVICGIPCSLLLMGLLAGTIWYTYKSRTEYRSITISFLIVFTIWCFFCYPLNIPFVWLFLLLIVLSIIPPTCRIPAPRLSRVVIMMVFTIIICLLIKVGWEDIRRISLQERAMRCFDNHVIEEYEAIYREHPNNALFLYNYGAMLHLHGYYKKSLNVLKICSMHLSDYNMMLLMGDDYQKTEQPDSALVCYRRANEMIPNRFLPLYYQMVIYQEQGEYDNAKRMAETIIHKKNKIKNSKTIQLIIKQAYECLED